MVPDRKTVLVIGVEPFPSTRTARLIEELSTICETRYRSMHAHQEKLMGHVKFRSIVFDEISSFAPQIQKPPALSPADEKKLKNFERLLALATVKRDRVAMSSLQKQIAALTIERLFK